MPENSGLKSVQPSARPGEKRVGNFARSSQFRYYIHDEASSCRLQLLGDLAESNLADLNGCWRTAKTSIGGRQFSLDLHGLRSVDDASKQWLASVAQEGAVCSPESFLRDLVACKHSGSVDAAAQGQKPTLFSRIVNLFRNMETAK